MGLYAEIRSGVYSNRLTENRDVGFLKLITSTSLTGFPLLSKPPKTMKWPSIVQHAKLRNN